MKTLVVANPKGGAGKSLFTILAIEWFSARGVSISITDADANQNVTDWITFSRMKGREIVQSDRPELSIFDTAGLPGAFKPFITQAQIVLVPFAPLAPDVARLGRWWCSNLTDSHRAKAYLIPNKVRLPVPTKDQVASFKTVRKMVSSRNLEANYLGQFSLSLREAVYGRLFNGSSTNFFESNPKVGTSTHNGLVEADALFEHIASLLKLKEDSYE